MIERFKVELNGKTYDVDLIFKRQRNAYYRFKNEKFIITAPLFTSKKKLIDGLKKFAPRLVKTSCFQNSKNYSFEEDFIYLLGEKYSLSQFCLTDDAEIDKFIKQKATEIIIPLVRKYEAIMDVKKPYKITARKVVSRFGSNSLQTHHLSFCQDLAHYSEEIITSVVVHELAHEFERNHGSNFYKIVYKYCPNYKEIQKKLKRGVHK